MQLILIWLVPLRIAAVQSLVYSLRETSSVNQIAALQEVVLLHCMLRPDGCLILILLLNGISLSQGFGNSSQLSLEIP